MISRRAFIAGVLTAASLPTMAQQARKKEIPRIGVLWHGRDEEDEAIYLGALKRGLRDVGYVDGQNIRLENRFADEQYERFNSQAVELARLNVNVIVAVTPPAALAAKRATTTIPVVFVLIPDPVRMKLVDTLSRPGGNVTGLSQMMHELQGKRLQLLKECVPTLKRVALMVNPANGDVHRLYVEETQAAQAVLGVTSQAIELDTREGIERVFTTITRARFDGVIFFSDGLFYSERRRIAKLLLDRRLPSMWFSKETAEPFGALMSYGPDLQSIFHRAGYYLDRILKGSKPADLPVEFPTKYPIVLNLKTARALNVTFPPSATLRAEESLDSTTN